MQVAVTQWEPSDVIALAAIGSSALVALGVTAWSHRHDKTMRKAEWREQSRVRSESKTQDHRERWLARAQEISVDARSTLMNDLNPETMSDDSAVNEKTIIDVYDRGARPRIQTLSAFSPDEQIRAAAKEVDRRFFRMLGRAGYLVKQSKGSAEYQAGFDSARRAYGEVHLAIDKLIEAAGGPKAPDRVGYPFLLETDP